MRGHHSRFFDSWLDILASMGRHHLAHETTDFAGSTGIQLIADLDEGIALGLVYADNELTGLFLFFTG